jgi:hypothetical protein
MISKLRRAYNDTFRQESYEALLRDLESSFGLSVEFRICETPLFLSEELTLDLKAACQEILTTLTSESYLTQASRAIPPGLSVPGEDAHTTFLQLDFAIAESSDGRLIPQLIELQGFPSLYGLQWWLDGAYRRHFEIPQGLSCYFNGIDEHSYASCLKEAIVGDCDPENVVLLEIDPLRQKTLIDFLCHERLLGIRILCIRDVRRRGRQLFYLQEGREIPIRRIYNRTIFDELQRKGIEDDLFFREWDVEWAGHPNWYYKISKFSLPFLRSRYVPPAAFLSDLEEYPEDLENYVLKPLYSFAGLGVELGPRIESLRSIARPQDFILQRKIDYAPLVETPDGPAKAEVRMMFVWKEQPLLVQNLVRMSKGAMMGVDFNKSKTWVGSSIGYHPVPS